MGHYQTADFFLVGLQTWGVSGEKAGVMSCFLVVDSKYVA